MKIVKFIKYTGVFALFVVLTSFKPADKYTHIQGGKAQQELLLIND